MQYGPILHVHLYAENWGYRCEGQSCATLSQWTKLPLDGYNVVCVHSERYHTSTAHEWLSLSLLCCTCSTSACGILLLRSFEGSLASLHWCCLWISNHITFQASACKGGLRTLGLCVSRVTFVEAFSPALVTLCAFKIAPCSQVGCVSCSLYIYGIEGIKLYRVTGEAAKPQQKWRKCPQGPNFLVWFLNCLKGSRKQQYKFSSINRLPFLATTIQISWQTSNKYCKNPGKHVGQQRLPNHFAANSLRRHQIFCDGGPPVSGPLVLLACISWRVTSQW